MYDVQIRLNIVKCNYPVSYTHLDVYKRQDALYLNEYNFRPDRMMVLHIEAYDWNCPQHITPRYTVEEIEAAFTAQQKPKSKFAV